MLYLIRFKNFIKEGRIHVVRWNDIPWRHNNIGRIEADCEDGLKDTYLICKKSNWYPF